MSIKRAAHITPNKNRETKKKEKNKEMLVMLASVKCSDSAHDCVSEQWMD